MAPPAPPGEGEGTASKPARASAARQRGSSSAAQRIRTIGSRSGTVRVYQGAGRAAMIRRVSAAEDALELLRSRSGLSIDEEGRFLHQGEPIRHERTLAALWRSLERVPDGRWIVRLGRESGYVEVRDTPYVVRGVGGLEAGDHPWVLLADGSREPLDPATLRVGADGVLRCDVKGGLAARFSRAAHVTLGGALEEAPEGSGAYVLEVAGRRWPVGREE